MGGTIAYQSFKNLADAKKNWHIKVEESRHRSGCEYSGEIGMFYATFSEATRVKGLCPNRRAAIDKMESILDGFVWISRYPKRVIRPATTAEQNVGFAKEGRVSYPEKNSEIYVIQYTGGYLVGGLVAC